MWAIIYARLSLLLMRVTPEYTSHVFSPFLFLFRLLWRFSKAQVGFRETGLLWTWSFFSPGWMGKIRQMSCWHLLAENWWKWNILVVLLVLWCSWDFAKHWFSKSFGFYSSLVKLFLEKHKGFALLFVLPFVFKDRASLHDCCVLTVSAQFWPVLEPSPAHLFTYSCSSPLTPGSKLCFWLAEECL